MNCVSHTTVNLVLSTPVHWYTCISHTYTIHTETQPQSIKIQHRFPTYISGVVISASAVSSSFQSSVWTLQRTLWVCSWDRGPTVAWRHRLQPVSPGKFRQSNLPNAWRRRGRLIYKLISVGSLIWMNILIPFLKSLCGYCVCMCCVYVFSCHSGFIGHKLLWKLIALKNLVTIC